MKMLQIYGWVRHGIETLRPILRSTMQKEVHRDFWLRVSYSTVQMQPIPSYVAFLSLLACHITTTEIVRLFGRMPSTIGSTGEKVCLSLGSVCAV